MHADVTVLSAAVLFRDLWTPATLLWTGISRTVLCGADGADPGARPGAAVQHPEQVVGARVSGGGDGRQAVAVHPLPHCPPRSAPRRWIKLLDGRCVRPGRRWHCTAPVLGDPGE